MVVNRALLASAAVTLSRSPRAARRRKKLLTPRLRRPVQNVTSPGSTSAAIAVIYCEDRQLNHALQTIPVTRARLDPETKANLARKRSEGKSNREAIPSLKPHVARRIWKLLQAPDNEHNGAMTIDCNLLGGSFVLT